jgi:hypothetical protein
MSRPLFYAPRLAPKAALHTATMLEAWHQAGIERADLAVRTANGAMLWTADCPLDHLPLAFARAHNVQQADIYVRPARGSPWPMVFLDDVAAPMARRIASKYATLAVHTSAHGGCHLWLRLSCALNEPQRCHVQRWLIPRIGADPGSVSGEHLGRLAGMKNWKRGGQWVNILHRPNAHRSAWDPTPALQSASHVQRSVIAPCAPPHPSGVDRSESAREWGWVCGALEAGLSPVVVYQRLLEHASARRGPDAERYARYTLARALRHTSKRH